MNRERKPKAEPTLARLESDHLAFILAGSAIFTIRVGDRERFTYFAKRLALFLVLAAGGRAVSATALRVRCWIASDCLSRSRA